MVQSNSLTTVWCLCIGAVYAAASPAHVLSQQEGAEERRPPSAVSCQVITAQDLADEPSVARALRARVTGLQLSQTSAQAGGGSRVSMRGVSSLRSRQPLVFIDGLRIADPGGGGHAVSILDQLNTDDVLLIEVFRGPAGTTLYGTDAAGGVIRIFTKQGTPVTELALEQRAHCVP